MIFLWYRYPDPEHYILWVDSISLISTICCLFCLFNLEFKDDIMCPNLFLTLVHWEYLLKIYNTTDIIPPDLFSFTANKTNKSSRRKRK